MGDDLVPRIYPDFGHDMLDMILDRVFADKKPFSDFLIG
jgi:hypothetical protein